MATSSVTQLKVIVSTIGKGEFNKLASEIQNLKKATTASKLSLKAQGNELRKTMGSLSGKSINELRAYRDTWRELSNSVDVSTNEFKQFRAELDKVNAQLDKVEGKQRRATGGGLRTGGRIAATALGAGVFGGPLGFGGALLGGGLTRSVEGAAAGAVVGATAKQVLDQVAGTAEYAASINKLKIALQGVAPDQEQYNLALEQAEKATKLLNVPQEIAIAGITRLSAAVVGAGGNVADASLVFRNVTAAIKATGGGAQDVQGAITAMVQVFSKGKVSAEELSGQLGERLPGAVTLFAAANEMSLEELQKNLKAGTVGLNELMEFIQLLGTEYGQTALAMAASNEEAGARMTVAFKQAQIEIGEALLPLGSQFQEAFTEFAVAIAPSVIAAAEGVTVVLQSILDNMGTIAPIAEFLGKMLLVKAALMGISATVGGLKILFAALTAGFTATGRAALAANAKVAALRTTLLSLTKIGLIVVGIELLINQRTVGGDKDIAFSSEQFKEELEGLAKEDLQALLQKVQKDLNKPYLDSTTQLINQVKQEVLEDMIPKALTQSELLEKQLTKFKKLLADAGGGAKIKEISADQLAFEKESLRLGLEGDRVGAAKEKLEAKLLAIQEMKIGPNLRELKIQQAKAEFAKVENDEAERALEKQQRLTDLKADFNAQLDEARLTLGLITEEEKLANDKARLRNALQLKFKELLDAGKISAEELEDALNKITGALGKIKSPAEDLKESFKKQLEAAMDLENRIREQLQGAVLELSDTFADFVVTGKNSFAEFTASVLRDLGRIIVKAAFLKTFTAFFPGLGKFLGFADGGVFAQNKIIPYAKGGVVNRPTLFPMANGMGLMGESGPEAVMPLRRGPSGKLGVEATGGGVGNVVVNVDASGSAVQGNSNQADQLGKAIGAAVQAELIKQKRPGGMLAGV